MFILDSPCPCSCPSMLIPMSHVCNTVLNKGLEVKVFVELITIHNTISVGANVFPWDFHEENKPTSFCVPWVSHITKNVDDQLGICSAGFKSQNSKWPPRERENGVKML